MSFQQFKNTLAKIRKHPKAGANGILKHFTWQVKRHARKFPFKVQLTEKSHLHIHCKNDINGCVALAWSMGMYDFNNMSFFRDCCAYVSDCVALDVGANIGTYSLVLSEVAHANIAAFEPHPTTRDTLLRNLSDNNRSNVFVHSVALSNANGNVFFSNDPCSPINSVSRENSSDKIEIIARRAEDYCKEIECSPSIVKIDVEGHEYEVLEGMGPLLKHVHLVSIEQNIDLTKMEHLLGHLEGPYFVNYVNRSLEKERGSSDEDPVYLSNYLMQNLQSIWGLFKG